MKKNIIPLVLLVSLLLLFRVGGALTSDSLPNIMPFAAVFFCAAVFSRACPMLLPAALFAWVLGSPVSSMIQGYPIWHTDALVALGAMVIAGGIGFLFMKKKSLPALVGGALMAAVTFYLLTNTVSFFSDPRYLKTWQGFTQALWSGVPGSPFPPTWVFFRNSLCANAVFTVLFVVALKFPALKTARRFGLEPIAVGH